MGFLKVLKEAYSSKNRDTFVLDGSTECDAHEQYQLHIQIC